MKSGVGPGERAGGCQSEGRSPQPVASLVGRLEQSESGAPGDVARETPGAGPPRVIADRISPFGLDRRSASPSGKPEPDKRFRRGRDVLRHRVEDLQRLFPGSLELEMERPVFHQLADYRRPVAFR